MPDIWPVACDDAPVESVTNRDPWRGHHPGLSEEWIVVTGAAGLIGRAVVERILDVGGRVLAVDKSTDSLAELERQHDSGVYLPVPADITSSVAETVMSAQFAEMRPRMMVHAAGWQVADGGKRMPSPEEWSAVFDVHVTAPVLLTWGLFESVH